MAVHIADPTSFIPLGSDLDYNASLRWAWRSLLTGRSVTYYYPDRVYPLYPWEIATACSLSTTQFADTNPGALASLASPSDNRYHPTSLSTLSSQPSQSPPSSQSPQSPQSSQSSQSSPSSQSLQGAVTPRPRALTIVIEFGADGGILDCSVHPTVLQHPIRLTYEEVEAILNETLPPAPRPKPFASSVTTPNTHNTTSDDNSITHNTTSDDNTTASNDSAFTTLQPLKDPRANVQRFAARRATGSNAAVLGFAPSAASALPPTTSPIFERVVGGAVTRQSIQHTLTSLYRLACRRRQYRERRGCIDFSFPEARFHVAAGAAEGTIGERDAAEKAEQLVMEMMVAAGEVVGALGKENVGNGGKREG